MNNSKQTKSKPITTSVPTFSIRFHAGGEELEEFYPSEEEEKSEKSVTDEKCTSETTASGEPNKHESSPMRDYLNKFGKRSSSIDAGINETTPPLGQQTSASDPWRIFSEFKGKLTKTVEEKLSEIKSKNTDGENSPKLINKNDKTKANNSKENSSVSDSEEQSFSECSIPKSSGLSSTAEDIELSSDDENSLAESDKTPTEAPNNTTTSTENTPTVPKRSIFTRRHNLKTHVQFSKAKDAEQVKILSTVHENEKTVAASVDDDVESGVEAYEDFKNGNDNERGDKSMQTDSITMVAPTGFVDLRSRTRRSSSRITRSSLIWAGIAVLISICLVLPLPTFLWGFLVGAILAAILCVIYYEIFIIVTHENLITNKMEKVAPNTILEIPAVKEYQPVTKFEGWMNEYPESYEPATYHIMKTQSVFLKLEGSILRISHTRSKIPKRAMWNEAKHHATFCRHRLYNLCGSHIVLLPNGLIHKRLWSKKYPICIILNKEKMNQDLNKMKKEDEIESDEEQRTPRKNTVNKDNEIYADPISDTPDDLSQSDQTTSEVRDINYDDYNSDIIMEDDTELSVNTEEWDTITLEETDWRKSIETKIYLFARTCRDKEDWFRRLVIAAHDTTNQNEKTNDKEDDTITTITTNTDEIENGSNIIITLDNNVEAATKQDEEKNEFNFDEDDYMRYMAKFNQVQHSKRHPHKNHRHKLFQRKIEEETEQNNDIELVPDPHLWFNALVTRILYDMCKNQTVINKFQFLIQRKISTIKLPYFIENIIMTDLSLGKSSPTIHNISAPKLDERGLWVNMDLTYPGGISMAIVTKLNLMKLKEKAGKVDETIATSSSASTTQQELARSPIYHSDVEDSAESSSDDEAAAAWLMASAQPDASPGPSSAKPNTGGRKFIKMVDRIASSKYFQHATDIKYIKRALEGVSKTEIKLTVELAHLEGTLTINIPPPPSDRVWLGFRENPVLELSAHPAFGEIAISFQHVTRWIEKKIADEFQKFIVMPNMEDFVLPLLIQELPK